LSFPLLQTDNIGGASWLAIDRPSLYELARFSSASPRLLGLVADHMCQRGLILRGKIGDVAAQSLKLFASRKFHPILTKEFFKSLTTFPCRNYIDQIAGLALTFC
jgi:hypothetical protein